MGATPTPRHPGGRRDLRFTVRFTRERALSMGPGVRRDDGGGGGCGEEGQRNDAPASQLRRAIACESATTAASATTPPAFPDAMIARSAIRTL